jgi:NADH dehydrogenase [ubiquinone] 1 alpha subcomplex assembly factor 1
MLPNMKRFSSLVFICFTFSLALAEEQTLFDFAKTGSSSEWRAVNDNVMGGVSSGKIETDNGSLIFNGKLSLENNGGFASIRSGSLRGLDLSSNTGLNIRVRGDGRTYALNINSQAAWNLLYRGEFKTKTGAWLEYRIPFKDLKPTYFGNTLPGPKIDASKLEYVGFILADKQAGPFTLEVAWIKTY